jgi:hypothetical protein
MLVTKFGAERYPPVKRERDLIIDGIHPGGEIDGEINDPVAQ